MQTTAMMCIIFIVYHRGVNTYSCGMCVCVCVCVGGGGGGRGRGGDAAERWGYQSRKMGEGCVSVLCRIWMQQKGGAEKELASDQIYGELRNHYEILPRPIILTRPADHMWQSYTCLLQKGANHIQKNVAALKKKGHSAHTSVLCRI